MTSHTLDAPSDTRETQDELRKLVNRIRIEQIKAEETQVIQESKSDPTALQRYRELQTRRKLLEAGTGVSG
jgi:DNA primase